MTYRDGFLPVERDVRLYYRVFEGDGDTVVMPRVWYAQMLERAFKGRTFVFYDPRHRGGSDRVPTHEQLGFEQDVADLESIRRQLGLTRISLIGHSYNSAVVAVYAMAHPSRVNRVLLVGALPPRRPADWRLPTVDAMLRPTGVPRLETMRRGGIDKSDPVGFCKAWLTDFLLPIQVADPAMIQRVPLDLCSHPNEWPDNWVPAILNHVMPTMGDWDYRGSAAKIEASMLVMQGERESTSVAAVREWTRCVPRARLLVVPGCGHYPFVECPEVFFPAADCFLGGGWPDGCEAPP